MTNPIHNMPDAMQAFGRSAQKAFQPGDLPTGFVQTTTAWESIPKFIRFTIWLYAILTVAGLAIWPILLIALVAV